MDVTEIFERLSVMARQDEVLRKELLQTRHEKNALTSFCKKAQSLGFPLYEMDVLEAGESFYAAMRRSTNGGGENSPLLEWEDDFFELFLAELEGMGR